MTRQDDSGNAAEQPDVQFEQAEYDEPAHESITCGACGKTPHDAYYTAGQAIFCEACRDAVLRHLTGGSGARRFFGALFWGFLAAMVGSIIWFGVRKLTGYEVGLVAIVVGLIVGAGIRRGSGGRGGWLYQTMAILFTYCSIVAQYTPDVFAELMVQFRKPEVAATQPASAAASSQPVAVEAETPAAPVAQDEEITAGKAVIAVAVLALVVFVIAFIAPIVSGFQNLIGLLIIGFALYEAWKLNKRVKVEFAGPWAVGVQPPPVPETAP